MANDRKVYTIQIDAETGQALDAIEEVEKTSSETTAQVESQLTGLTGQLDSMLGGAITGTKNAIKGIKGMVVGMKTLKAAIASTGIGLLVVALASIVSYFTSTKRGAERLQQGFAALSAAVSVITDRLSAFGETIVGAFENPQQAIKDLGNLIKEFVMNRVEDVIRGVKGLGSAFSLLFEGEFKKAAQAAGEASLDLLTGLNPLAGAIRDNADAIGEMVDEIEREAGAAIKLEKAMQGLLDMERNLRVERAEGRAEIERNKLAAEDVTKSTEERLEAAQKAFDLEQKILDKELSAARQRVSIIAQQIALGESTAEDLDKLADARVALAEVESGSLTRQIELNNKLNAIKADGARKELEDVKEFRDAQLAFEAEQEAKRVADEADRNKLREQLFNASATEIEITEAKYAKLREMAHGNAELERQVELQLAAEKERINAKSVETRRQQNQALANASINLAGAAIAAAISLNESGEKRSEAARKKAFERDKKLRIAAATISMIQGAAGAFQQGMSTYPAPFGAIIGAAMAAISVATGVAQIRKIKSQQYGSTGGGAGAAPRGGNVPTVGQTQRPQAPTIQGNVGQGQTQGAIRAYVVSKEGTNQAQRDQLLEDQASLVD